MATCLFLKRTEGQLICYVGTFVDETTAYGNDEFSILDSEKSSASDVKLRESKLPLCFGGVSKKFGNSFRDDLDSYASSLSILGIHRFNREVFAHIHGQVAYVANTARPEIVVVSTKLAKTQAAEAKKEDVKLLNSVVCLIN